MKRMRRYRAPRTNISLFTFTPAWSNQMWVFGRSFHEDASRTCGTVWLGFLGCGPHKPFLLRLWLRFSRAVTRRAGKRLRWTFRIR
jgi:hypothetical protein